MLIEKHWELVFELKFIKRASTINNGKFYIMYNHPVHEYMMKTHSVSAESTLTKKQVQSISEQDIMTRQLEDLSQETL